MKSLKVMVFGKKGCDKCKVLNKRLDKILAKPEYTSFAREYHDITTVEGLVNFADAEFLNPQRIPAFVVFTEGEDGALHKIPQQFEEGYDPETGRFMMPTFVGLQTDYSQGGGVITPADIEKALAEAVACVG